VKESTHKQVYSCKSIKKSWNNSLFFFCITAWEFIRINDLKYGYGSIFNCVKFISFQTIKILLRIAWVIEFLPNMKMLTFCYLNRCMLRYICNCVILCEIILHNFKLVRFEFIIFKIYSLKFSFFNYPWICFITDFICCCNLEVMYVVILMFIGAPADNFNIVLSYKAYCLFGCTCIDIFNKVMFWKPEPPSHSIWLLGFHCCKKQHFGPLYYIIICKCFLIVEWFSIGESNETWICSSLYWI